MNPSLDSAARAALWEAYCQHGTAAWAPRRHSPRAAQYRRALLLDWLWEPRPGMLAITQAGLVAIQPYLRAAGCDHGHVQTHTRTDKPTEAAE